LVVELPDGQKLSAQYGPHPGGNNTATDHFWTAVWIIPASYPNGTFVYKATATDMQGQSATWEPFKRVTSQLQVVAGEIEIKKPSWKGISQAARRRKPTVAGAGLRACRPCLRIPCWRVRTAAGGRARSADASCRAVGRLCGRAQGHARPRT